MPFRPWIKIYPSSRKKTFLQMDRKLNLCRTKMCPLIKIRKVITIQQIILFTCEIMKVRNTKAYDKYDRKHSNSICSIFKRG